MGVQRILQLGWSSKRNAGPEAQSTESFMLFGKCSLWWDLASSCGIGALSTSSTSAEFTASILHSRIKSLMNHCGINALEALIIFTKCLVVVIWQGNGICLYLKLNDSQVSKKLVNGKAKPNTFIHIPFASTFCYVWEITLNSSLTFLFQLLLEILLLRLLTVLTLLQICRRKRAIPQSFIETNISMWFLTTVY